MPRPFLELVSKYSDMGHPDCSMRRNARRRAMSPASSRRLSRVQHIFAAGSAENAANVEIKWAVESVGVGFPSTRNHLTHKALRSYKLRIVRLPRYIRLTRSP